MNRSPLTGCLLATLLACNGVIDEPAPTSRENPVDLPDYAPVAPVLPRLTQAQYRNAVGEVFGQPLPGVELEADTNPYLFTNIGGATTTLSERGAALYDEAGHTITTAVFADPARRDALFGCTPTAPGDECVAGALTHIGRRLFRRPLTTEEQERWTGISVALADGDAWRGARHALAGMLQSPHFLYRVEIGEPMLDQPGWRRLDGYEMASRLSFLFWNSIPDEALLEAAERGDLDTEDGILMEAWRLLEDERAEDAVQRFFAEYLDLGRLDGLDRDPETYPTFTPTVAASMRSEVELLVHDLVFRQDADVRRLFSTRETFVNAELAALYGVDAPDADAITFVPVTLPEDGPRAGVLTTAAFLSMNAHPTETSPTLRGKYVRERVLCQTVQPPPDDVITDLEMGSTEGATLRDRLEQHRDDPACASCHAFIDPPGMLFEHFDSMGAYRTEEPGGPVDSTGDLDGVPLEGARDLAALLRDDPRVPSCMVQQLYRHATGRLEQTSETAAFVALEERFAESGYRFKDLMIALATSDAFRTVREVSP